MTGKITAAETSNTAPLAVGWATVDITPPKPVALIGQLHKRISSGARDPLTATALALEAKAGRNSVTQAILVSCDVLWIQRTVQERLQKKVRGLLPDFDARMLFLNATHTHTGPGFVDSTFKGLYDVTQDAGVMKASEYADVFIDRVCQAAVEAWRNRKPSGVSWALSSAVVSLNRRAHFFDGTTVMYGDTAATNFSHIEGPEDHSLKLLLFWHPGEKLSGMILNLACPSQETEHLNEISADFWHDLREEMRRRHGSDLFVLPQCAPAGDLSPHPIYRKQAEQIMQQRRGLSRRQEIARRIANAVDDVLPTAKSDVQYRPSFLHAVVNVTLPVQEPKVEPFYETDPVNPAEIHVLRLGDVALATNPFELYVDYATRIEARSPAVLTMLVQLSGAGSGYLPTARAVQGGGYSADKFVVGPAGGQTLVEETLKQIQALWRQPAEMSTSDEKE
jgi:hypothetical protein